MWHDKIRAAARKRMAETGEPYAVARREVIRSHREGGAGPGAASSFDARWFALDYSDMGRISRWTDTRHGGGPGWAAAMPTPAYAIDDQTALKVTDGTVEVVSEGHWRLFTP